MRKSSNDLDQRTRCYAAIDELTASLRSALDTGNRTAKTLLAVWLDLPDTKIEAPRHAQADDDGGLKTIKEIADHLKVGKNTIRRWIDERDFPSRRAGDDYRFDLNEVDRWTMEAHTNLSKNNGHKC